MSENASAAPPTAQTPTEENLSSLQKEGERYLPSEAVKARSLTP
jgi:hypothetical protein